MRDSWATGESLPWTKVHDLPDFVYFNHEIHVNKGLGCASCHGRVDQMPLMYAQNTLQMEWCLNCHRNPAKNLRPTSQIYNMAWEAPADDRPVWCAAERRQDRHADRAERELHDQGSQRAKARRWHRWQLPIMRAGEWPGERCSGGDGSGGAALREIHQPG